VSPVAVRDTVGARGGASGTAADALVTDVLAELRRHGRDDLATRLVEARERMGQRSCAVLVVGEFNKGKSSLVNALLNVRVCATDADVATAVPTFVRYGETLSVGIRDGPDGALRPVDLDAVEEITTRSGGARAVDVTVPRELLRDGLVLVDTPGVGGGLSAAYAATTLRALAGADAVVVVTDAGQELTAAEMAFLQRTATLCGQLLLAVTKIDFYPEWRRIVELDRDHLRRAGLSPEVIPLSAPLRHHALRLGDRALTAESGYPVLAAHLRRTLAATADDRAATTAAVAHGVVNRLVTELATEHAELTDPAGHDRRVASWKAAKRAAEELLSTTSGWQQTLNDRVADMASTVDLDLGVRLRRVRKELTDRLATDEPGDGWAELEPWLYQRTNEALADHFLVLRRQADEVADAVAARFETAGPATVADVSHVLSGASAAATGHRPGGGMEAFSAARLSRIELGVTAFRGGSVIAAVGNAVGVAFPPILPVTLPLTAVLAGVLARRAWRNAREARLQALRAEADRAAAAYLEEVELHARKDSRDAVRRVQQHLREAYAAHAAELHASVTRNLEVLARSVREQDRGSTERRAEVAAELKRLRALAERAEALAGGAP
jgi:dynamin family protein